MKVERVLLLSLFAAYGLGRSSGLIYKVWRILGGIGSFGPSGFIPQPVFGSGFRVLALGFWVVALGAAGMLKSLAVCWSIHWSRAGVSLSSDLLNVVLIAMESAGVAPCTHTWWQLLVS